ncbi:MAG TPA: mandelate racemase/muconate lactonizing enzyme family protein [Xanthobacteraceae bacterium]|nr:mandelate racemase/muconate lactonizing enzyme family protein [Xanthobacteraceae bacterium]
MKITRVTATTIHVPIKIALVGAERQSSMSACLVDIETDNGLVGHGFTAITDPPVISRIIETVAGPEIIGDDPLAHERIWDKLYWTLMPRGQTGYAAHALAAIDVALWDIKGKFFKQPVWRLLGGSREKVPVYVTFGFDFFDRDQLGEAAKLWVKRGFNRLKMTVGHSGLARRDSRPLLELIREDERRVRAVREAAGEGVEIFVDANCSLDLYHAQKVAEFIRPYGISFFEEPITQNDALLMAQLRRTCGIPLACGQNEGLLFRFRDLLRAEAIDFAQPNVVISGGFTQCLKIAGLAAAFNVPTINGGAWQYHNMHLQGGIANGSLVEIHYLANELYQRVYTGLPTPENGWLALPERPGLGFAPNPDAVREYARNA